MISGPDPRPKRQLMALHRHPHFHFCLRVPLAPSPSATPPGRQSLGPIQPALWASASAGPAGSRDCRPRHRDRPATPRVPGPGPGPPPLGARAKPPRGSPAAASASHPAPRTGTPTLHSPPAGSRKAEAPASPPRPQVGPGRIRPEEVQGPVSGCAIAAWVPGPGFPGRGAGAGWCRGFRGAAGDAAGAGRGGVGARVGSASRAVRNHGGPSA